MTTQYFGLTDDLFSDSQKIKFASFKNGEHQFRVLPPFAQGKLYHQVDLHWGFTDEQGRKKALTCTKYSHKTCPICDEADKLNGELKLMEAQAHTFSSKEEYEALYTEKSKRYGEIKKKPTYLWNIINSENQVSVLQLSWNGHEPLLTKIKFLWQNNKIDVTNPENSQLLWCQRSGLGAKTRYVFELMQNSGRKLENIGQLVDLTKVYKQYLPTDLRMVLDRGFVPNAVEDPNNRDFTAPLPSQPAEARPLNPELTTNQVNTNVAPAISVQTMPAQNTVGLPKEAPPLVTDTTPGLQNQPAATSEAPINMPNVSNDMQAMMNLLKTP